MTKLLKPVSRLTQKEIQGRKVIVTIAPCGNQNEARIGLRLHGKRTQYVALVSDLFRLMALWYGIAEKQAKRQARKNGIPWKQAKKQFQAKHSI